MTEHFIDINKYTKIGLIGRGGFGDVYKIQDKETKAYYAAKVSQIEFSDFTKNDHLSITREVNILNQIVYASVIKFVGYSPRWYDDREQPVIITEYCKNGSLQNIIDLERHSISNEYWDNTKKLINIYGIAAGMAYLHSNNVIHRDLKPGNILMDDMLFPKIADFGLSKIYNQNTSMISSTAAVKGTLAYIAPEIFESNEYSTASDVYAFAFIVYEIMTNEQPYKGLNQAQIMMNVLNNHARPQLDSSVPDAYKQLIEQCWSQNPSDRPSFPEIIEILKTDAFITDTVEAKDFEEYVDYIDKFHNEYKKNNKILHPHDLIKKQTKTFRNVTVKKDGIEFDPHSFESDSNQRCVSPEHDNLLQQSFKEQIEKHEKTVSTQFVENDKKFKEMNDKIDRLERMILDQKRIIESQSDRIRQLENEQRKNISKVISDTSTLSRTVQQVQTTLNQLQSKFASKVSITANNKGNQLNLINDKGSVLNTISLPSMIKNFQYNENNGYLQLTNQLMIQWGRYIPPRWCGDGVTIQFPIPFRETPFLAVTGGAGADVHACAERVTNTSFMTGFDHQTPTSYIAIGRV